MFNKYMGTYNVKFFPLESIGYGPTTKRYTMFKPMDLRDVYLINLNGSNEAVFEREDGAVMIIPAELILIMLPTEKMEEPILETKKETKPKYKVVQEEDYEGKNNET